MNLRAEFLGEAMIDQTTLSGSFSSVLRVHVVCALFDVILGDVLSKFDKNDVALNARLSSFHIWQQYASRQHMSVLCVRADTPE